MQICYILIGVSWCQSYTLCFFANSIVVSQLMHVFQCPIVEFSFPCFHSLMHMNSLAMCLLTLPIAYIFPSHKNMWQCRGHCHHVALVTIMFTSFSKQNINSIIHNFDVYFVIFLLLFWNIYFWFLLFIYLKFH